MAKLNPPDPICIGVASDDLYAPYMGVVLFSLLKNNPKEHFDIFVMNAGISQENIDKINLLLKGFPKAKINWITCDAVLFNGLKVDSYISLAAYYRIFLPQFIPESFDKYLYLDSDTLVLGSIRPLWETDIKIYALAAVQEANFELGIVVKSMFSEADSKGAAILDDLIQKGVYEEVSSTEVLFKKNKGESSNRPPEITGSNFDKIWDISQHARLDRADILGLPSAEKYFNSGVMLINLNIWRKEQIAWNAIDFIRRNPSKITSWDQDGLNVVLYDRWKPLNERWNKMLYAIYGYGRQPIVQLMKGMDFVIGPKVLHYSYKNKPWLKGNKDALRFIYFKYLSQTPWKHMIYQEERFTLLQWSSHFIPLGIFILLVQIKVTFQRLRILSSQMN